MQNKGRFFFFFFLFFCVVFFFWLIVFETSRSFSSGFNQSFCSSEPYFTCRNGKCIPLSLVCDDKGIDNCGDGSDLEENLTTGCKGIFHVLWGSTPKIFNHTTRVCQSQNPYDDISWSWEKEKKITNPMEPSRRTEILLGQERMLKGIVSKCVVMVKQPQVVQSQLSPFLRNKKKQKTQDPFVHVLVDHLALCCFLRSLWCQTPVHWKLWHFVSGSCAKDQWLILGADSTSHSLQCSFLYLGYRMTKHVLNCCWEPRLRLSTQERLQWSGEKKKSVLGLKHRYFVTPVLELFWHTSQVFSSPANNARRAVWAALSHSVFRVCSQCVWKV